MVGFFFLIVDQYLKNSYSRKQIKNIMNRERSYFPFYLSITTHKNNRLLYYERRILNIFVSL